MTTEHSVHQCEPWQMLELDEGGLYCGACGKDQPRAPEKSAAEIWDEAMSTAARTLHNAKEYGGAYGQQQRRPSNFTKAANYVEAIPNPYANTGIPARESEEWKALCRTAEQLGTAVAAFQNAKDDYTTLYPKDSQ